MSQASEPVDSNVDAFHPTPEPPPATDGWPPAPANVEPLNPSAPFSGPLLWRALLWYAAFVILVPLVPLPHRIAFGVIAFLTLGTTVAFMFLQMLLALAVVGSKPTVPQSLGRGLVLALLWVAALFAVHPWPHLARPANHFLYLMSNPVRGILLTVSLSLLGVALSRIIRERNVLLPVAFAAMPIDYLGAMAPQGFTHDVVKHAPQIVQAVSVGVPMMGGIRPIGFVGPGDVLFISFFLAAVVRLDMNVKGTFRLMYVLLTLTMLIVLQWGPPIAALIPMGIAVVAANWRMFRLERSEAFAMLYALIVVVSLAAGFYAFSHHVWFGGK